MPRLFHYTSEDQALAILDEVDEFGPYVTVGTGNWFGDGFYATPIVPVDEASCLQDVITDCFGGGRTEAEVSWVLVLRAADDEHVFKESESDSAHWLIHGSPMEVIWLSELLERVLRWRGTRWETVWVNDDF